MSSSPYAHSPWSSSTSLSSILSQTYQLQPSLQPSRTSSTTQRKKRGPLRTFHPFLRLPLELRRLILTQALTCPSAIDIHTVLSPLHSLLLTSHHICNEALSIFFSINTFRILPTHPAATVSRAQPLLSYIQPVEPLQLITSLELRLGPFWTSPPRCWIVAPELRKRLGSMRRVRKLKVFVERDPSVEMYEGFRKSKSFYTDFCGDILKDILGAVGFRRALKENSKLKSVVLDGVGAAVKRDGDLMVRLQKVVREEGLEIVWGQGMRADENEEEKERGLIGTMTGVAVVDPPVTPYVPVGWTMSAAASSAEPAGSHHHADFGNQLGSAGAAIEDIEFSMATLDLAAQNMSLQGAQLVYPHA